MSSTHQWLVFLAGPHAFACAMGDVVEILPPANMERTQQSMPQVVGWLKTQGKTIPVVNLLDQVHHKHQGYPCHEIIVAECAGQFIGLAAEKILAISGEGEEQGLSHCIPMDKFSMMNNITYLSDKHLKLNLQ